MATTIVNDLRELADFLETRPEIADKIKWHYISVPVDGSEFPSFARALGGKRSKAVNEFHFGVTRWFGSTIEFKVFSDRDAVCTRRVVGTREVPAQEVPEKIIPAHVIPARTEEIVEWECPDSVLAPKATEAVA